MTSRLIIIRGNSASGKSTIARMIRERLGEKTMLIPQDTIRREILNVKDRPDNPAIRLIPELVLYGKAIGYDVVLEGILSKKLYGSVLNDLIETFGEQAYAFYMDVSFDETVRRHGTKPSKDEYGSEKMKEWWIEKDYLNLPSEHIIPESYTAEQAVERILKSLH